MNDTMKIWINDAMNKIMKRWLMWWTIFYTICWYFALGYSFYKSSLDDLSSISLIESSLDDSPSISLIIVIVIVVEGGSDAIMNASLQARAGK